MYRFPSASVNRSRRLLLVVLDDLHVLGEDRADRFGLIRFESLHGVEVVRIEVDEILEVCDTGVPELGERRKGGRRGGGSSGAGAGE